MQGNTVQNVGYTKNDGASVGSGILEFDGSNLAIDNNQISLGGAYTTGIFAYNNASTQTNVSVTNNTIIGAGPTSGGLSAPNFSDGIDYQNGVGGAVTGNTISGFDAGLENDAGGAGTSAPTLTGNTFGSGIGSAYFLGDGSYTPAPKTLAAASTFTAPGAGQIYVTNAAGDLVVDGVFSGIQAAVDAASTGDFIRIGAGTYSGNVVVGTAGLTIVGAGDTTVISGTFLSDNNIASGTTVATFLQTATGYSGASGSGFTINASGTTIQGVKVQNFLNGIDLGNGADSTALTNVDIDNSVSGINKSATAAINGLIITDGSISDGYYGVIFTKDTTIAPTSGNADDVLISGTSFSNLDDKGIYAETLSNSTITGVTMTDVGQFGRVPSFGTPPANTGNGIDLNLKNGTYSGDTIENFTLTNTGASNTDNPAVTAGANSGAIVLETRNDGATYSAAPANYVGTLTVENGSISGTSTGIQVGEPGKANSGPTVAVNGVSIAGADNTSGSHGDVANDSTATLTFAVKDGAQTVKADPNSTGSIVFNAGAGDQSITGGKGNDVFVHGIGNDSFTGGGGVDTTEGYAAGATLAFVNGHWTVTEGGTTDTLNGIDRVVIGGVTHELVSAGGGEGFTTIQAALDDAVSGGIIDVTAGTYNEGLNISKAITIVGANAGVSGSASRGDETIITGQSTITTTGGVTIDGVEFLDNQALVQNISDNFTSLAINATSTAGDIIENSVFDREPSGDTVSGGTTFVGSSHQATHRGLFITAVAADDSVTVENNDFKGPNPYSYAGDDWRSGIYSEGGVGTTTISDNSFTNTRSAINADNFSSTVTIEGNNFVNPASAISIGAGSDVSNVSTITNNSFGRVDTDINFTNVTTPVSFNASSLGNVLSAQAMTEGESFEVDPGLNAGNYTGVASINTIGYENFSSPVTIDLAAGTVTGPAVTGVTIINNFQNAIGSSGNDTFTGDGVASKLIGGGGIDTVEYAGATVSNLSVVGGNWTVTGAHGTDTLVNVDEVDSGSSKILLVGDGGFATIQAAVDAAHSGDTIDIAAGVYSGNVTITVNNLTIIGQGDSTVIEGTFKSSNGIADGGVAAFLEGGNPYTQSAGSGVTLSGVGDTLENLKIDSFTYGVSLSDGANGATLSGVDITDGVDGLHKGTTAGVNGLRILNGSISDVLSGIELYKTTSSGSTGVGNADDVLIQGTSFSNIVYKGIYAETLSNSTIDGVVMTNVGQFGAPSTSGTAGSGGDGIDLNLKNNVYTNDTIENFTLTDTGLSTGGVANAVGNKNGGAIVVEARDQGSYASVPASYTGVITIQNGTINGTSTGIQAGEPGQTNPDGPAVIVTNVNISNAQHNVLHGDVANVTQSTMTIVMPTGSGGTYTASPTTTGAIVITGSTFADTITTGGGDDIITGNGGNDVIDGGAGVDVVNYTGATISDLSVVGAHWTITGAAGTDTLSNIEEVSGGSGHKILLVGDGGFATIQAAIDAASAGDTIDVAAGTYNESLNINKAITIDGANWGVSGSASRGDETIITGQSTITTTGGVTIDGVEFLDNQALVQNISDNFVSLTINATSTAGDIIENSVFDREPSSDTVSGGTTFVGSSHQATHRGLVIASVAAGNSVTVDNNAFTGANPYSYAGDDWRSGIYSNGGAGTTTISNNTFTNTRAGINADSFTSAVSITGNIFSHDGTGVAIGVGSSVGLVTTITNNTFNNVDGVFNFQNVTTPVGFDLTATGNTEPGATYVPGAQSTVVVGGGGTLKGTANSDLLQAVGGSTTFIHTAGGDTFMGAAGGTNVAEGYSANAVVSYSGGHWTVTDAGSTDTLYGIEQVVTASTTYDLVDQAGTGPLGGGYQSVQSAENAATAGDTILIAGGTYSENVTVTKNNLTIENLAGSAVTIEGTGGYSGALQIAQGVSGTTVENTDGTPGHFVLQGGASAQLAGLYLVGGNSNTSISGVTVIAPTTGDAGDNAVITGGGLSGVTFQSDVFSGSADQLVYVNGTESGFAANSGVSFLNNTFSGSAGLLLGLESTGGSVTGNTFSGSADVGVGLAEGGVTVTGNTFDSSILDLFFGGNGSYDPAAIVSGNTYPSGGAFYLTGTPGEDGVFPSIAAALAYSNADDTILGNMSPIYLTTTLVFELETLGVDVSSAGVILQDSAADVQALTAAQIAGLEFTGVTEVQATDNASVTLTAAKAVAFENAGLSVGVQSGYSVIVSDTLAHINALTTTQIAGLGAVGVTVVNVLGGSMSLTAARATAFATAGVSLSGATVTVSDTAANISAAFTSLNALVGISKIIVIDSSTNKVTITAEQGADDGIALAKLYLANGTTLAHATVSDTAANVANYVNNFNAAVDTILASGGSGVLQAGTSINAANLSETGAGTTLTVAGNLAYAGAFTQGAGSKLVVNSGDTLTLSGTNSLSGATSGAGALTFTGGNTTFNTGSTLSASAWSLTGSGTTATLGVQVNYSGAFSAGVGTQLALIAGGLILNSSTTLAGVVVASATGHGVALKGATNVSGLTIAGNALVQNYATATQSGGSITVGDNVLTDRAVLYNAAASVWNITDDSGIARGANTASLLSNVGLLEKTAGSGTSTIAVSVTDTGSIAVNSGTLAFGGPSNSFAGALSGLGTLLFSSGASTLNAGASATVANLGESNSGTTLTVAANLTYAGALTQGAGSKLVVNSGDTLTLSGTNSLSGATSGTGALTMTGGNTTFKTGATLSTSAWSLTGSGTAATLSAQLSYSGAFSAGAGTQFALNTGGLSLNGATTFAGVVVSSATGHGVALNGATNVSGLTIAGNAIIQNYAAATQSGGSVTVGDNVLADKAALYNAAAAIWNITDDSGVARGANAASFLSNAGLLEKTAGSGTSTIAVSVTDTGSIAVNSGTLAFAGPSNSFAGALSGLGTLLFSSGASTLNAGASATVANLGESNPGTTLTVAANLAYAGAFTQGAGSKLVVNSGDTLTLSGTNLLSGATSGAGAITLTGGNTTFTTGATLSASALSLTGAGTTATLGVQLNYSGAFSAGAGTQLALNAGGLILNSSTTLAGVIVSSATGHGVALKGATNVSGLTIAGNATVQNYATATQSGGSITVGDNVLADKAVLYNTAAGVWNIADDSGIARGANTASFISNAGLLEKIAGSGTSTVAPAVVNTGAIAVLSGILDFKAAVTGAGSDTIANAASLQFDATVGVGQTIDFTGSGEKLYLGAAQSFAGAISGFDLGGATGDAVQLLGNWTESGFSDTADVATLRLSNGTNNASLIFNGIATNSFNVSHAGGNTVIS